MDSTFTAELQHWLDSAHTTPAAVTDGARLLLALNGDRRQFERARKNPVLYLPYIEYEIGKYLRIRLAQKTTEDIRRMIATEMPVAEEILSVPHTEAPRSKSVRPTQTRRKKQAPTATADVSAPTTNTGRGRRADHDALPDDIKALWDKNAERWKRIKEVYETLKSKEDKAPCDRFDDCQMLIDLDKNYRADMQRYDEYEMKTES